MIFISYSHDSDDDRERVLEFAERLRTDGFDAFFDRYVNGTPAEGWPRWMLNRLDDAEFVLVVCTEICYRRFRGHEQPDRGTGVDWEGALITQELYDARSRTVKFVPVLLDAAAADFIPKPLRSVSRYTLDSERNYKDLCDFLHGVAGVEPRSVSTPPRPTRRRGKPATFDAGAGHESPIFDGPYSRNPWFTGREDLLTELAKRLNERRRTALTQVIKGLGGIGKTQAAVEFVYRHRKKYPAVFWLRCESKSQITSQLSEIAVRMQLAHDPSDPDDAMRVVRQWLQQHDGWLLICDNADDPQLLKEALPKNATGHVLLTSRSNIFTMRSITDPLELSTLSNDEAVSFLGSSGVLVAARTSARAQQTGPPRSPHRRIRLLNHGRKADTTVRRTGLRHFPLGGCQARCRPPKACVFRGLPRNSPKNRFLLSRTNREQGSGEAPAAAELAAALGELRLALEQAAAYIAEIDVTFDTYLKKCRKRRLELLEDTKPLVGNYLKSVVTTWSVNFEQVEGMSPAAGELLRFSAFVNPDQIPFELVRDGATELGDVIEAHVANNDGEDAVEKLLAPLVRFALVARERAAASYDVHRLVQEVVQHSMTEESRRIWAERTVRALDCAFPSVEFVNWDECRRFLPHALAGIALIRSYGVNSTTSRRVLNSTGRFLRLQGRYAEAELVYQQAIEIWRTALGEDHPNFAAGLNNLAGLYDSQGRYAEAEPLYQQAIEIARTALGENHPNFARTLKNLAGLLRETNRESEAAQLAAKTAAIEQAKCH